MILRPWPRILRSFPMTDLVPGSAVRTRDACCEGLREIGTPAGSSACGSAEELRVNMGASQIRVGIQTYHCFIEPSLKSLIAPCAPSTLPTLISSCLRSAWLELQVLHPRADR